jgi:aminoglycoside 6'-N-acetyltransferase I
MKLISIEISDFKAWKKMREALYESVDDPFHDEDMQWINKAVDKEGYFIVTDKNEIAGFVELSIRSVVDGCIGDNIGYLEGLYLKPEFRGRQLGRKAVNQAINWFKTHGCTEMATDTEIENRSAQSFFSHLGFSETWRVVQFKKDLTAI